MTPVATDDLPELPDPHALLAAGGDVARAAHRVRAAVDGASTTWEALPTAVSAPGAIDPLSSALRPAVAEAASLERVSVRLASVIEDFAAEVQSLRTRSAGLRSDIGEVAARVELESAHPTDSGTREVERRNDEVAGEVARLRVAWEQLQQETAARIRALASTGGDDPASGLARVSGAGVATLIPLASPGGSATRADARSSSGRPNASIELTSARARTGVDVPNGGSGSRGGTSWVPAWTPGPAPISTDDVQQAWNGWLNFVGDVNHAVAAGVMGFHMRPTHLRPRVPGYGRLYAKESRRSGKERATDVPSWARGEKARPTESPDQAARRILKEHGRPFKKGAGSDYSKIKKHLERG